jgi:hypothetical protein
MKSAGSGKNIAILFYARARVFGFRAKACAISLPALFNRLNILAIALLVLFAANLFAAGPKKEKTILERESEVLDLSHDKTSPANKTELKRIIRDEKDQSVRSAAIQSLGGRSDSFQDLQKILNDTKESLAARESAASAIALSPKEAAFDVLLDAFKKTDGELKEHIGICLQGLKNRFPNRTDDLKEVQP